MRTLKPKDQPTEFLTIVPAVAALMTPSSLEQQFRICSNRKVIETPALFHSNCNAALHDVLGTLPGTLMRRCSRLDFLLLVENLDAVDRPTLPVRAFCRDR